MNKIKVILFSLVLTISILITNSIAENENSLSDLQIGAFYFPGWDSKSWHWNRAKNLKEFKEREPLEGWDNIDKPEYMKKEIDWAFSHGINFFAFDWYWNFIDKKEGLSTEKINLNYALSNFLAVNNKMSFSIISYL